MLLELKQKQDEIVKFMKDKKIKISDSFEEEEKKENEFKPISEESGRGRPPKSCTETKGNAGIKKREMKLSNQLRPSVIHCDVKFCRGTFTTNYALKRHILAVH